MTSTLLSLTDRGLYCAQGDFYIDPWRPVERAVITHAHSDHARSGCNEYLTVRENVPMLRYRLGDEVRVAAMDYGETQLRNGVRISLHPAGHMRGAAQIRLEYQGEIACVTGDFKLQADPTCLPFEPIACHTLVTESTFGLPVFRWEPAENVVESINEWWRSNQSDGRASLLFAYSLGKTQRLLSCVDHSIGPVFGHGACTNACRTYEASGAKLPQIRHVNEVESDFDWSQALILAPPSTLGSSWTRRFRRYSTAVASGWMRVRGMRRRRAVDLGFAISDHVDWYALLNAIEATKAENVWVTHGFVNPVVRYLRELGYDAKPLQTRYVGEALDDTDLAASEVNFDANVQAVDEKEAT